jgi:hypothetical protein
MTDVSQPAHDADAADAARSDDAVRAAALERRIAELEASTNARIVRAELKAEAVRHGMIDLDGLKLVDATAVTLDEAGEVRGAATVMRDFKRAKPWLFGMSSTSSTAAAPPSLPPKARTAKEMSYEEWQSARADLVRRR